MANWNIVKQWNIDSDVAGAFVRREQCAVAASRAISVSQTVLHDFCRHFGAVLMSRDMLRGCNMDIELRMNRSFKCNLRDTLCKVLNYSTLGGSWRLSPRRGCRRWLDDSVDCCGKDRVSNETRVVGLIKIDGNSFSGNISGFHEFEGDVWSSPDSRAAQVSNTLRSTVLAAKGARNTRENFINTSLRNF